MCRTELAQNHPLVLTALQAPGLSDEIAEAYRLAFAVALSQEAAAKTDRFDLSLARWGPGGRRRESAD